MTTSVSTLKKMGTKQLQTKVKALGLKTFETMSREEMIRVIQISETLQIEDTSISRLRAQVAEAEIKHVEVQMPVDAIISQQSAEGDNELMLQFADGTKAVANRLGLQYFAYRLRLNDKSVFEYLTNKITGAELTTKFNQTWNAISVSKRGKMIAAIYKNELVGMLRNYTAVSHNELIDAIEEFGLAGSIVYSNVDQFSMNMIISVAVNDKYIAGLRVMNGHSGHVSFRYSSAFRVNDFEFDIPMSDRVRHLSSVQQSVANLTDLLEGAGDLRIDEMLRQTPIRAVQQIVRDEFLKPSKRQNILLENPEIGEDCSNALEYVISLSRYTKTRGYKKAASSILNRIIDVITKKSIK